MRPPLGASNQFPSFPKGPVLAHLPELAKQCGGAPGRGAGQGAGTAPRCPRDPGRPRASPPVGAAHTHTLGPSAGRGRWPFLLQYKGSLLRSHKSRQDPLLQQALGANRRNPAEFPNGRRSLQRWEQLRRGEEQASRPRLPQPLSLPKCSSGSRGWRSFVREERRKPTFTIKAQSGY